MARNVNMPYESKRSSNLLKLKDFQDFEQEIIAVNEGVGKLAGHAGSFTCKMKDGKTFNAKLKGSQKRLKEIFDNPNSVIGKMAIIRYQNLTLEGIPRFPVALSVVRDYE